MSPTIDMTTSPYMRGEASPAAPALVQLERKATARWIPSRYNARTLGDDGRLILWNTLSGSVSVFPEEHRSAVVALLKPAGTTAPLDTMGEYLLKRGYLVSSDLDEMELFKFHYAREHWRTDILELILLASEDCNFRCVYCYEKFKRGTMQPEVRDGVRALTLQRARYLKELAVTWFGGEPLYGWEAIEELGPFFKDITDRHNIAYYSTMTTNAYLLTEDRAEKLLRWGCRQFQITLDGLPEEHNCKRVGRDGSPTYEVILENLRALHRTSERFRVNLRMNFDENNAPRLAEFLEAMSREFGGDKRYMMRFYPIGEWGGPNDETLPTCGDVQQDQVIRDLREKAETLGLRTEGGILGSEHRGNQVCYAARPYNFIVGASGKLMKCTIALDDHERNVVGHLHPNGTMELKNEFSRRGSSRISRRTPNARVATCCQGVRVLRVR